MHIRTELFSQLDEPLTGEALFDCLTDLAFFIKTQSRPKFKLCSTPLTPVKLAHRPSSPLPSRRGGVGPCVRAVRGFSLEVYRGFMADAAAGEAGSPFPRSTE